MRYIRYTFLALIYSVFIIGFTKGMTCELIRMLTDKEVHFLVFVTYPFVTYFVLPDFSYKKHVVFILAISLPVLVEVVQLYIPHRSFCVSDIKYSLAGSFISLSLINYFK